MAPPFVHHAVLLIEAKDDALQRPTRVTPSGDARGGVELDVERSRQHHVHGIEDRRLSRTVVAEKKEVAALADFNRLVDEVVEADQADAPDGETLRRSPATGLAHSSPPPSPAVSLSDESSTPPAERVIARSADSPSARTS